MTTESARPGPPATSPSIVLLTLAHRVESELGAALSPLGLTVSRLGLLGHIAGVPGASFSDLARMSGITVQSVHTAVKALAGAGLVRDGKARAGSASTLELTPEGARLMGEAMKVVEDVDERLFGPDADPIQRRIAATVRAAFAELSAGPQDGTKDGELSAGSPDGTKGAELSAGSPDGATG
ncbi:MarR family winged helix-turn-helix transcriptional regulator [Nonomuraea roseoviolacea]|uniref:DNA-binding MarR family transcriptional regulator n=1 Tax=Nonomuraea roseoviolacea subsp. carminata TaxID=160689 RepID=A0ABT1K4T6_9ACTN|nr:MarR family winged helix-turn-helix transcriptional regulator [Nonomuraea roseoviolacea]MCP2348672.1 DNA-binding MarR family transcriptional regulator [Nonomuraea roseoviolacea subsp. carminata]